MKYLPYVLKHLRRNWMRTLSTVFAMSICIFLFCTLQTVLEAVNWGLQSANASRLVFLIASSDSATRSGRGWTVRSLSSTCNATPACMVVTARL